MEELADSIEAMCDITQPISPAITSPVKPAGNNCFTSVGKARSPLRQDARGPEQAGVGIVEPESDDPGQDDEHRHEQFQEAGEDHAHLPVPDVLGRQGPLGDELVAAPVEDVGQPHAAEEDADPGQIRIVPGPDHVELLRRLRQQRPQSAHHRGPVLRASVTDLMQAEQRDGQTRRGSAPSPG